MKFKKLFAAIIVSAMAFSAVAMDAFFNGEEYNISVSYNNTACPGDAVFVRVNLQATSRKSKVTKDQLETTSATLSIYSGTTRLRKSEFYLIPEQDSSSRSVSASLLAGIPLSSWWTPQELNNLKLTVSYAIPGMDAMEFDLPFALTEKDFVSETIELDAQNTAIKTDTSTQRQQQIDRLNEILATTNSQAVYQTSAYSVPTTITRKTSFFADRRVYAYSNGKSSTSLHYGIDYGAPEGTPVRACAKGKVVLADWRNSTGWSVVLEHLPGLYSLYYHMSELKVQEGQIIEQGTLVGLSGKTGLATGPHLHWEMRLNGEAVNPDFFTSNFTFERTQGSN